MSDDSLKTPIYPEPTIVVGLGRFGLAVAERIGADWRWLATSAGDDKSLKNLRLLTVRSQDDVDDEHWLRSEGPLAQVARASGEDDLPTMAVRFVLLRALGLIRFRDGTYQLGLPRDAGVVESADHQSTRRRRYFEWQSLDTDPIRAVDRLHRLASDNPDIDLFITPIVERVFHGQSPRLLLHLIGRWRALGDGRDPAPWAWLRDELPEASTGHQPGGVSLTPHDDWLTDDDRTGLLDGLVPPPLPPRPRPCDGRQRPPRPDDAALHVPPAFIPTSTDLATPLSPRRLLRVDWQTSGWVADELDNLDAVEFTPVDASLYRLGFFDHDNTGDVDPKPLRQALKDLAVEVHRGLLRIWLDLQREREESHPAALTNRRRAGADDATFQCLQILGELVLRPFLDEPQSLPKRPQSRSDRWVDGPPLPSTPSASLQAAVVDHSLGDQIGQRPLLERLAALGLHFDRDESGQRPLLRDLALNPEDLASDARLTDLRRKINEETRHLVSFDHLKSYRQRPTRRPPRLTIFVVADVREPFARRAIRPVLRALHQELMRGYGPLFNTSRDGFDRPLSIIPLLWTPHPADPFGGDHPEANRVEEASILESVHDLRRWVEMLPASQRCIPQIFINSRVTDAAVLGLEDAVDQTRDFLSFQIRNDLARHSWLRQTAADFTQDDLFSTFTCIQIDFPAERGRQYLANRLSRDALIRLQTPGRQEKFSLPKAIVETLSPPPESLLTPPRAQLQQLTVDTAKRLSGDVEDRLLVDAKTTSKTVHQRFDDDFEQSLYDRVHTAWRELTRNRGAMDDMVDELRRDTSLHRDQTLVESARHADRLIATHAAKGGLTTAQVGFRRLRELSRELLTNAEGNRRRWQDRCLAHDLPDPSPIADERAQVLAAADAKPDRLPIIVGLVLWAAMVPALGAPVAHGIARALELHSAVGPVEYLLGPLGWLLGGVLLFVPVFLLLRRHMRKTVNDLRDAIADMAESVRQVVEGPRGDLFGGPPSIRSFFAARLQMTAALAERNFADRLHDQITTDNKLAYRLFQSIQVQQRRLRQRAEALGVRPATADADDQRVDDDLRTLFESPGRSGKRHLLGADHLVDYYYRRFPTTREIDVALPKFLASAGGFERWRHEACLADTDDLLDFGRQCFQDLVSTPVGANPAFEDDVGHNLTAFVAEHYANVGFAARFVGYEGFDSDGLRRLAEAALVLDPRLRPAFDKARKAPDSPATTETLRIIEAPILPNTAFILSLVQGINARSIHNLRRHESFFDRLELPDPSTPWGKPSLTLIDRRPADGASPPDDAPKNPADEIRQPDGISREER